MTTATDQAKQLAHAQKMIGQLQSQNARQRQEIARLTRQIETLQQEKADLRFDLRKAEARAAMQRV